MPFSLHALLTHQKKSYPPIDVNTQSPLWLEGKTCVLGIDHNMNHC